MSVVTGEFETDRKVEEKCLFNPVVDFLLLGGGYMVVLLPIALFFPTNEEVITKVSFAFLFLTTFINHPHFAHSYHIFYRDFFAKLGNDDFALKNRFIFAGAVVPVIMVLFFIYCILSANLNLLGFAGNAMAFFVGWHYVKQGYGMLMVSSVLKRSFYNNNEKKLFLVNAYLVWIFSWLFLNSEAANYNLWGIEYFALTAPGWMMWMAASLMTISSVMVAYLFFNQCRTDYDAMPKSGAVAYIASLYAWLLAVKIHPVLIFIIPAFHSTQYLVVVWRYEINRSKAEYSAEAMVKRAENTIGIKRRLISFALFGIVAGAIGFWIAPLILSQVAALSFGAGADISSFAIYLFMFWVFINIHHFFIDNVIWRKENTDVSKYLFS